MLKHTRGYFMTWPTDLARQSTNPFSAENMISRNLMDQALKADRDRIDEHKRKELSRETDRHNQPANKISNKPSKAYMELSDKLNREYHEPRPRSATTSSFEASTNSNYSNYTLKERVTDNTETNTNKYCSVQ